MNLNCRYLFLLVTSWLILPNLSLGQAQEFQNNYKSECAFAKELFFKNKEKIDKAATSCGTNSAFLFSIVAPEVTQFSYLSNKLENYSLKVFYVQGGKDYANFSIGYFQMKPSFIEELEKEISNSKTLSKTLKFCLIDNPTERSARVTRLERLETFEWQLIYLTAFYQVLELKYKNLTFENSKEKLRFYATAYNSGFNKPIEQLKRLQTKNYFPHFSEKKYNYADLACWFLEELN